MRSVVFSPAAEQDLADIWGYIACDNPAAADKLLRLIDETLSKRAEMPGIGHRRTDVTDPRYSFFTVRPYVLAYRFDDVSLTVVRVLHGARDFRKVLGH
jgi:plasmid stabilization system protein ParE